MANWWPPPGARPGHVVGDGPRHTIAELIEIVNQDPRRGVGHEKVLTRLELDAQAQKMLESVNLTRRIDSRAGQICIFAPPQIFPRAVPPPM